MLSRVPISTNTFSAFLQLACRIKRIPVGVGGGVACLRLTVSLARRDGGAAAPAAATLLPGFPGRPARRFSDYQQTQTSELSTLSPWLQAAV